MKQSIVKLIEFRSYQESIPKILDQLNAAKIFKEQKSILLKPNLVNTSFFPITTSPEFCKPIIEYIKSCSNADIIIGEGCGDADYETSEIFTILGYDKLAYKFNIKLMDLNHEPIVRRKNPENKIFSEIYLPKIAFEAYIISLPVLKAHSLATITGTLKNMIGFAPPKYYKKGGYWKKSSFHKNMHQSIVELNSFILPDLTIMDASVGLSQFHLGGPECDPKINKIIGGFDAVKIDKKAAMLLKLNWKKINHIYLQA